MECEARDRSADRRRGEPRSMRKGGILAEGGIRVRCVGQAADTTERRRASDIERATGSALDVTPKAEMPAAAVARPQTRPQAEAPLVIIARI